MKWPVQSFYYKMASPAGELVIVACDQGVCAVLWPDDLKDSRVRHSISELPSNPHHPTMTETIKQLTEYFQGQRQTFDLPLYIRGTEFQKAAWSELLKIPYGKTISYHQQAVQLGDANKARAVGLANSNNLLAILIPCHRVVSKNGSLNGFRGGLQSKRLLLDLELRYY